MVLSENDENNGNENVSEEEEEDTDFEEVSSSEGEILIENEWTPIFTGESITNSQFPFEGTPEIRVPIAELDPLQILQLFFEENVLNLIVMETNRYAEQDTSRKSMFSRTKKWTPITVEVLWVFLGILILQSIVEKPIQRWFWTNNKIIETLFFSIIMSAARFELIMRYLHFSNNQTFDANNHPSPKLNKIYASTKI